MNSSGKRRISSRHLPAKMRREICSVSMSKNKQQHVDCVYCHRPESGESEMLGDTNWLMRDVIGVVGQLDGVNVHYCCAFFAQGLPQKDAPTMEGTFGFRPVDILANAKRFARSKCKFCRQPNAAVRCSKCPTLFHFPCGIENGVMYNYEKFKAFCSKHRPQQSVVTSLVPVVQLGEDTSCSICLEEVENAPGFGQLYSKCCHRWFHRNCLQSLAFSAGSHHLKCPLCNNVDDFKALLINFGFHIPQRDAAWERESPDNSAFRDHFELTFVCYARTCICPEGRFYDGGLTSCYDHLVCCLCGNNAVHRSCTVTAWKGEKWVCIDCDESRNGDSGDESSEPNLDKYF